jgi:hypothetical protein
MEARAMRRWSSQWLSGSGLFLALLACGPAATTLPPTDTPEVPTAAPTLWPPTEPAPPPPTAPPTPGEINGLLWKDRCLLSGGEGGEPLVLGQGCISTGPNPWEWGANQIFEPGFEPGIGGVTIHLGSGACPMIGLTSTVTAGDGAYAFSGLPPGTYCVSFDFLNDGNDAILIPGGLSFPERGGEPRVTVTLDPGDLEVVNFGWTYQFGD